jgi:hypothetical protein
VAPGALDAVRLPEDVVEQDIGAAGRVGARVVADHRIEAEHRLDRIALEPAVEVFAGRAGKQRQRLAPPRQVEGGEHARLQRRVDQALEALRLGWDLERQRPEHVGDLVERREVGGQRGGIGFAELGDFRLAALQPAAHQQVVAGVLRQRQEVRDRAVDDPEPVLGEPHVGDDFGLEQADGVARHRIAEAGVELLRNCRSADVGMRFADADSHPGPTEIPGADQAVVAAADDHRVVDGRVLSRMSFRAWPDFLGAKRCFR